jgi:hypothetical protein
VAEAAQADYETLRVAVLAGTPLVSAESVRFARAGLWGLITRPAAEPIFAGRLHGGSRPAWTPYGDPRLDTLVAAYELVLSTDPAARHEETGS